MWRWEEISENEAIAVISHGLTEMKLIATSKSARIEWNGSLIDKVEYEEEYTLLQSEMIAEQIADTFFVRVSHIDLWAHDINDGQGVISEKSGKDVYN
jgi:hypothetical protein